MGGRNWRREEMPADSILPPPSAGTVHCGRTISSIDKRTGLRRSAQYICTGEFPEDHDPDQAGGLSKEFLVRASALVHDADLADWIISRMEPAVRDATIARASGNIYNRRGEIDHDPTISAATKAALWHKPPESLDALLESHRADVLEQLTKTYGEPPTVLTCSGYGHHAVYWLPTSSGRADDDSPAGLRAAWAVNRAAVAEMNARAGYDLFDTSAVDAGTRVLREIGYLNEKGLRPRPVEVISRTDTVVDLPTLYRRLVPTKPHTKPHTKHRPEGRRTTSPLPDGYTGDVRTLDIVGLFQSQGMLSKPAGGRGFYVSCPWESEHGSHAEAWIVPSDGTDWPGFSCHHANCKARRLPDVMAWFGADVCMAHTGGEYRKESPPPVRQRDEEPTPLRRGDEVELSSRLVAEDFRNGAAVFDRGDLHAYDADSGCWRVFPPEHLRVLFRRFAGWPTFAKVDKDGNEVYRKLRVSQNMIKGAAAATCDMLSRPGFFDDRLQGCGFKNGAVTQSGELLPHSKDHRLLASEVLPYVYRPINSADEMRDRAPRWTRFLESLFLMDDDGEEKAVALMEFVGVAMLGAATTLQKAMLLFGDGGCGKSTMLDVLMELFPPESRCTIAPHEFAGRFRSGPLATARINAVPDLPSTDILSSGELKAAITGDQMTFERKFRPPFTSRPRAAHLMLANELPAVRDRSDGFWRRYQVIRFARRFHGAADHDPHIARKVATEAEDVAAVCIFHGVQALRRGEYTTPASSVHEVKRWRTEQNSVWSWIEEELDTTTPNTCTRGDALFPEYKRWCEVNGLKNLSRRKFYPEMERWGLPKSTARPRTFPCRLIDRTRMHGVA